jgi:TRAP-type C4-dicarboxylate transport system permease small subunit
MPRYVECRSYLLKVGATDLYLRLYEAIGYPVQRDYLGEPIGFFFTEVGALNKVMHMWGYDSLDARAERRARLFADPRWLDFLSSPGRWSKVRRRRFFVRTSLAKVARLLSRPGRAVVMHRTGNDAVNRLAVIASGIMNVLLAAILATMVVLIFTNVALRYLFNSGIVFSEEVSRYLFVWLTFVGAVAVLVDRGHQASDFLVNRLSAPARAALRRLSALVMLGAVVLFGYGSWQQAMLNMDNWSPVSGVPVALFYLAGVVSSIGLGIVLLARLPSRNPF